MSSGISSIPANIPGVAAGAAGAVFAFSLLKTIAKVAAVAGLVLLAATAFSYCFSCSFATSASFLGCVALTAAALNLIKNIFQSNK